VFFDLFFEVEPFEAILIAHRTHGHSKEFVLGAHLREGVLGQRASSPLPASLWV